MTPDAPRRFRKRVAVELPLVAEELTADAMVAAVATSIPAQTDDCGRSLNECGDSRWMAIRCFCDRT
jgi:hypothetical protein